MIRIRIEKTDSIHEIVVSGHSRYEVSGKDIVCASVSSIVITTVNALLRVDPDAISYDKQDGYVKLMIQKHTDMIDLLIDNMISLLEELEQDYKKYVKIDK